MKWRVGDIVRSGDRCVKRERVAGISRQGNAAAGTNCGGLGREKVCCGEFDAWKW